MEGSSDGCEENIFEWGNRGISLHGIATRIQDT
jgi:hypothetical protein